MARELVVFGAYVPTLLLMLILAGVLGWLLDWLLARVGVYRFVWHPPLFRLAVFVCLFSALGLAVYR